MAIIKEKLIECVPNFSEGRDLQKIEQIKKVITSVKDVNILAVDSGNTVNRSVITMTGTPVAIEEAAFRAIKKAAELIDMNKHHAAHPRIGATDVCPIIPLKQSTMKECITVAGNLAKRVGEELEIPVFLYEFSAKKKDRRDLANIRKGGYQAIAKKMTQTHWKPDFGPDRMINNAGVTVIGARKILIAFNISINTSQIHKVNSIAQMIRAKGGVATGNKPGLFRNCKAIGWFIPEYNACQVSVNLTDYKITAPHMVYEAVKKLAKDMDLEVSGSEIIGLIPNDALLLAGKYYCKKKDIKCIDQNETIETAITQLGLNHHNPFNYSDRILKL